MGTPRPVARLVLAEPDIRDVQNIQKDPIKDIGNASGIRSHVEFGKEIFKDIAREIALSTVGVSKPPEANIETKDTKESNMFSFGSKLTWFYIGLLVGCSLHTMTVFIMILIGVIVDNQPLPDMLGSVTPQMFIFTLVKNILKSIIMVARKGIPDSHRE